MKIISESLLNKNYKKFLSFVFNEEIEFIEVNNIKKFLDDLNTSKIKINLDKDLLIYTGGEDVNPNLYGEKNGRHTFVNEERDLRCGLLFNYLPYKIKKLGICRGAQYLTVRADGKLIQHVTNHTKNHFIEVMRGNNRFKSFDMTSTHHQMMYPFNLPEDDYKLIAWSKFFESDTYLNGKNEEIELANNFIEPEIVYYPKINGLAIQGHPEFEGVPQETLDFIRNIILDYLYV